MKSFILILSLIVLSGCAGTSGSRKQTTPQQVMNLKVRQPIKVGGDYIELVSFSQEDGLATGAKKSTATLMYSGKVIELHSEADALGKVINSSADAGRYRIQLLQMRYGQDVMVDLIPK